MITHSSSWLPTGRRGCRNCNANLLQSDYNDSKVYYRLFKIKVHRSSCGFKYSYAITRLFSEFRMLVSVNVSYLLWCQPPRTSLLLFYLLSPSLLTQVQLLVGNEVTISGTQAAWPRMSGLAFRNIFYICCRCLWNFLISNYLPASEICWLSQAIYILFCYGSLS